MVIPTGIEQMGDYHVKVMPPQPEKTETRFRM